MEIPFWPAKRPIILADQAILEPLLQQQQPQVSELCFAGLYLFRHAHAYQISWIGNSLVITGHGYDNRRYALPPIGGNTKQALEVLFNDELELYGADEQFVQHHLKDRAVSITADRDNSDYLYLRTDLADLPGASYHKKRNRIVYLTTRHSCLTQPYSLAHRPACHDLLAELTRHHKIAAEQSISRAAELDACAEALEMADELGLQGVVIRVDGTVRGFALGERLNPTTAVCHFEKADPYLEGLPQLLNREFATHLFTDCMYLNREQDLGEAGLRQAKSSYHPVTLLTKFRICPT